MKQIIDPFQAIKGKSSSVEPGATRKYLDASTILATLFPDKPVREPFDDVSTLFV